MTPRTNINRRKKPQKEYNSLSEFYLDQQMWHKMQNFYKAIGQESPPEPQWNPSKNYVEYD